MIFYYLFGLKKVTFSMDYILSIVFVLLMTLIIDMYNRVFLL